MIKTTLNLKTTTILDLERIADKLGFSCSNTIKFLLGRMAESKLKQFTSRSITYQKKDENCFFHVFHINYTDSQYEMYLDLRKVMKMSLSYIVAYAVETFKNEILDEDDLEKLNSFFQTFYLTSEYGVKFNLSNKIKDWCFTWGVKKDQSYDLII